MLAQSRVLSDETKAIVETIDRELDGLLLTYVSREQCTQWTRRSLMNPAEAAPTFYLPWLCRFFEVEQDVLLSAFDRLRSRGWIAFVRLRPDLVRAQIPLFRGPDGSLGFLRPAKEPVRVDPYFGVMGASAK